VPVPWPKWQCDITDRSFRYASPRLWNQLPDSFRQPHQSVTSRFTSSPTSQLISVITPTLVIHHSFTFSLQAQNLPFQQILPTVDFFYLLDCLTIIGPEPITLIILFLISHFKFLFISCSRLSWLPVSFLLHVKYRLAPTDDNTIRQWW